MFRRTLKILLQMQQEFSSVSDHFTTLRSKRLKIYFYRQIGLDLLDVLILTTKRHLQKLALVEQKEI